LNVQRRHQPTRLAFSAMDRLIFAGLYRLVANAFRALTIVKPDTVIRWHRAGFRSYWRWKSWRRCGRPAVALEICRLIRAPSRLKENRAPSNSRSKEMAAIRGSRPVSVATD